MTHTQDSAPRVIYVGSVGGECVCGCSPCTGLDCGPYLPGQAPRHRSAPPKAAHELAAIRSRAWATRRAKYGERGHR